jgi:hypothetical protein
MERSAIMEDKLTSNPNMHHPNNFKCRTHWLYTEDGKVEEPEQRTAQYEMDVVGTEFGTKLKIRIFSRVGTDPLHKRDYYQYIEVPIECTFTKSLLDILSTNLLGNRT